MENQNPDQGNINQQFAQQFGQPFGKVAVPNSTAVLVLGIISIPVCICYFLFGIPGIVLSIVALALNKSGAAAYEANPSLYTVSSYNNLKAGKICAIIGLIINSLWLIAMICITVFAISLDGYGGPNFFR
jgi:hypothetical protein